MTPVLADPFRLRSTWAWAQEGQRDRALAAETAWRKAVDAELEKAGVFERVKGAIAGIGSEAFQEGFVARQEARAAARDENDLRQIALDVLAELGVDLTDVIIRLRRARAEELPRGFRRQGAAQVKLRPTPTVEAAQRAIDAAAAAGYPRPGSPLAGAAAGGAAGVEAQAGHGSIVG
jgi:hypothetical protein